MAKQYATNRKVTETGNSVCFTVPPNYAEKKELVDEDGSPRDVECEVIETDDGGLKYRPVED